MLNRRLLYSVLTLIFAAALLHEKAEAQENLQISFFPGYHVFNSDKISANPNASQTDWIFGGNLATRFGINNIPVEYSIGYSQGNSRVVELQSNFPEMNPTQTVDLRYRTLPQELLWVKPITDRIELLTGINVTAQQRTLMYSLSEVEEDRLFSIGLGLSGKLHMVLTRFNSGNGSLFAICRSDGPNLSTTTPKTETWMIFPLGR